MGMTVCTVIVAVAGLIILCPAMAIVSHVNPHTSTFVPVRINVLLQIRANLAGQSVRFAMGRQRVPNNCFNLTPSVQVKQMLATLKN